MDNINDIARLRLLCGQYGLSGREILDAYTDIQLASWYNGAGPDSWLPVARETLTALMTLFKPVVLIHDTQFEFSDGTDEGFARTVADWCANTAKIVDAEYPLSLKFLLDKNYRRQYLYWHGVKKIVDRAIATDAAKEAWLAAHNRREQKNA